MPGQFAMQHFIIDCSLIDNNTKGTTLNIQTWLFDMQS